MHRFEIGENIYMSDYKILITDGLDAFVQSILRASTEVNDKNGISAEGLVHFGGDYDGLIVRSRIRVTAAAFNAAARLKVVSRAGVVVDNIELDAANKHNPGDILTGLYFDYQACKRDRSQEIGD
jgi:phosphoglycerate dehydrogenase-like enzyme